MVSPLDRHLRHVALHLHGREADAEPEAALNPSPAVIPDMVRRIPDLVRRSTATATVNAAKPVTDNQNLTIPIAVGVAVPITMALVILLVLHRRHVKKLRLEDANDRTKSLDFGMDLPSTGGVGKKKKKNRMGGPEMQHMGVEQLGGRNRGMSLDIARLGNPYLLPPGLHDSRESIHSLTRSFPGAEDPYQMAHNFSPHGSPSLSPRPDRRGRDDSSSYTGSSGVGHRQENMNQNLVRNAQRMSKSDVPGLTLGKDNGTIHQSPLTTPRDVGLKPASTNEPRESYLGNDNAAIRKSNNYLAGFIQSRDPSIDIQKPKSPPQPSQPSQPPQPLPTSQSPKSTNSVQHHAENNHSYPPVSRTPSHQDNNHIYQHDFQFPQNVEDDYSHTQPAQLAPHHPEDNYSYPQDSYAPHHVEDNFSYAPTAEFHGEDPLPSRNQSFNMNLPPQPLQGEEHYYQNEYQFNEIVVPPPGAQSGIHGEYHHQSNPQFEFHEDPNQYYDHNQEYHQDMQQGLGVADVNYDNRRLSIMRPLPPDDPTDNPEQRANRIRSFYKEYFSENEPARAYAPASGAYFEDYDQEFLGDGTEYDPTTGQYVVAHPPYAEPITRRAMTPPPRGPPRFQGSARHQPMHSNPGSPRSTRSRAYSTASTSRLAPPGRGPPRRHLPPPAPLTTLPTPHLLRENDFGLANDFAPPTSYKDRAQGRSASPFREQRPYSPSVPVANTLASSFDELPAMPSPHHLRKSGFFTGLDFAPPPRFKDRDTMSDAGSIRSGRSNGSAMSAAQINNIRSGAYRVSRIPKGIVGTKDELANSLKPTWKVGS